MKLYTLVVWICFAGLTLSGQGPILAAEKSAQDTPKTIDIQLPVAPGPERLRKNIRESMEDGTITSIRGGFLTKALWSKMEYMASKEEVKIVADPNGYIVRERLAKEVLETELYNQLESYLLKVVESDPDDENVQIALRVLGKGLSSARARPILKKRLEDSLNSSEDANEHPGTLFGLAEALCYMGDETGIDFLCQAFEWEGGSSVQPAAIVALSSLATTKAKNMLLRNSDKILLSEDPTVAYYAFDNLKRFDEFKAVISKAACQQLKRLAEIKGPTLDRKNCMLLLKLDLILYNLMKNDELTQNQLDGLKEPVITIIRDRDIKAGEAVQLLFPKFATDEDAEIIGRLLNSESADLRTAGIKGLRNCNKDIQRRFMPELIKLTDDPDWYTRDLALFVIRRYKGEITGSGLPKEVFVKECERIKQWWKDEKENKM